MSPARWMLAMALAAGLRWLLDMLLPRVSRRSGWSLAAMAAGWLLAGSIALPGIVLEATDLATAGTLLVVSGTLGALLLASIEGGIGRSASRADTEVLLLAAAAGMIALVSTADTWTAFVAFEAMSIPFYGMVAFGRGRAGAESGLRLVLPGAVATVGFFLGAALMGPTIGSIPADARAWFGWSGILIAVLFKGALLPFGFWVGDVYRGAPSAILAALATAPKWAAVVFAARWVAPVAGYPQVQSSIALIAGVTMLAGTLLAMQRQTLRGILAWSGVAHMGFALLILLGPKADWAGSIFLYGAAYILGVMAAMASVAGFESAIGSSTLASIRGVGRRGVWLPGALLVALLSLAGIPFLLGFWGKFYAMLAAARTGHWTLLGVALTSTVLGLYVYLRVAGAIFLSGAVEGAKPIRYAPAALLVGLAAAVATLALGLVPGILLDAVSLGLLR